VNITDRSRVSTLIAVVLDVIVWRKTVSRGKSTVMKGEKGVGIGAPNQPYDLPQYADSRSSLSGDQYVTPSTQRGDRSGYEVPEEQFNYDADTSYKGGHQPIPKRD